MSGQTFTASSAVSGIAKASIASLSSQTAPASGSNWISTIYDFNTQTAATSASADWVPDAAYAADGWLNGNASVNGTSWNPARSSKGLNCDYGTTPSGATGPNGGMTSYTDGTIDTATTQRYLYKEGSSSYYDYEHVVRTPGYNFSTLMNSTANNLRMRFGYQAYGANITPNIWIVYVATTTTSNAASATGIDYMGASGNTMASGAVAYTIVDIDLNAYRTINAIHYFWIILPKGNGFRCDTAIDSVYFEEY